MNTLKVKIFFEDEAPRLGAGWRHVTARIGRKWVRLEDHMGRRVRLTIAQYERLRPQPI